MSAEFLVGQLIEALDSRSDAIAPWYPGFPTPDVLSTARDTLQSVVAELRIERQDANARFPLVNEKLVEFRSSLVSAWQVPSVLRGPLDVDGDPAALPSSWFGYNRLEPKSYFTDSPVYAEPRRLGEQIGRVMARGETAHVLQMLEGLHRSNGVTLDSLTSAVDNELHRLRELGRDPIVVIVGSWEAAHRLVGGYEFGRNRPSMYRDAEVHLEYADAPATCVVLDPGAALEVTRWAVTSSHEWETTEANNRLLVSIREIDEQYALELLEDSPNLLVGENGEEESRADAARRLQRFAHVRAWVKLRVALIDDSAGLYIPLPSNEGRD